LDCKGFTILDARQIPALVVNAEAGDYAPRTFTLLHEYAHLLLRQTGVSDENPSNSTERFCNQFAAYLAMPGGEFKAVALALRGADQEGWSDSVIGDLARTFKVSRPAVALHLEDMAIAPAGFYQAKMRAWHLLGRQPRRGGLSTHAGRVTNKLGVRHVRIVLEALDSGRINKLEAHELLNVRPEHFGALREEIRDRHMHYGGDI
jgi:Zn-dependent peptidase ImmA (M78 family)